MSPIAFKIMCFGKATPLTENNAPTFPPVTFALERTTQQFHKTMHENGRTLQPGLKNIK